MTPYASFAGAYDALMADVDYDKWAQYVLSLLALEGVHPGARVLDAACGTGKLTLPLSKAGYLVTGADMSEDMLRLASDKARAHRLSIPFVCQRMEELELHRPVEAIVSACDGVNYLASEEEVLAFFSAAQRSLVKGGILMFDISSRYKLRHILSGNMFGEDLEDVACLWQNSYDESTNLLEIGLTLFMRRDGVFERFRERHIQRAHLRSELLRWMRKTGLEPIATYGFLTMEKPLRRAERIQFVARRM